MGRPQPGCGAPPAPRCSARSLLPSLLCLGEPQHFHQGSGHSQKPLVQRPPQQNRCTRPGLRGAVAHSPDTDSGVSEAEKQPQQTTRPGGLGGSRGQRGSSSLGGVRLPLRDVPGPRCGIWCQHTCSRDPLHSAVPGSKKTINEHLEKQINGSMSKDKKRWHQTYLRGTEADLVETD